MVVVEVDEVFAAGVDAEEDDDVGAGRRLVFLFLLFLAVESADTSSDLVAEVV